MASRLVIGTRGSKLALWQAHHVADRLRALHKGLEVELTIIKTSGDRIQDKALREIGGKGLFVKEIEEALLEERVDVAVHSMKDVPAAFPEGLYLSGMLERASAFDALLSNGNLPLAELRQGAAVGTGSLRRQFQLLAIRPDLKILPIRGNVDTRIRKLRDGEDGLSAIVLAVSGLERLGWGEEIAERLESPRFVPAIGQGALGLESRVGDKVTESLIAPLRHTPTEVCVSAERGVLERLNGNCHLPIACHGTLSRGGELTLMARLGSHDGGTVIEDSITGGTEDPRGAGLRLAERLLDKGARELLDELGV